MMGMAVVMTKRGRMMMMIMIMIMMTMLKIYHPISPAVFFPSRGSAKNPRAQKTTYHTTQVINELIMKHVAAKIKKQQKNAPSAKHFNNATEAARLLNPTTF